MQSNDYHFVTHWHVPGTCEQVASILADTEDLPRWWPTVYLDARELAAGDSLGIGKKVSLLTKGWLPYRLRWQFVVTESDPPHGFALVAQGDLVGRGIWTLKQSGSAVEIVYDWTIQAEKPLLKYLSFIMKPIFSANHRWAMARGEESLRAELKRRRQLGFA